jgi:hypothetical protein
MSRENFSESLLNQLIIDIIEAYSDLNLEECLENIHERALEIQSIINSEKVRIEKEKLTHDLKRRINTSSMYLNKSEIQEIFQNILNDYNQ